MRPFEDADLPEVVALFLACEPALNMGMACHTQQLAHALTTLQSLGWAWNGTHTLL